MEYKATAFQGTTGRVGGTVRIQNGSLHFESEGGNSVIPLSGLNMKRGGASNRLIFLSNPATPQVTIYTQDARILNELKEVTSLASDVSKIQTARTKGKIGYLIAAIATIVMVYLAYIGVGIIYETTVESIPVQWEQKLGETIAKQFRAQSGQIDDPVVQDSVNTMTRPLLEAVDSQYDYHFYITKDTQVNAFALPGGYVFINSGLLLEAERPEEVMGVLAHEMAHVEKRHGLRSLIRRAGIFIAISALFGDAEGLFAVLADQGGFLLSQAYSRDLEREADSKGLEYLSRANVDASGLLDFFERLKSIEEKLNEESENSTIDVNALSILNTHPATDERISDLKEQLQNLNTAQKNQKIQVDMQNLKSRIRNIL